MSAAHDFEEVHFNRPTWCSYCKKFIASIFGKQGFKCRSCGYAIHHKCFESAVVEKCLQKATDTESLGEQPRQLFEGMPSDVIYHILSSLPDEDMGRLCRVSKWWHNFVTRDAVWRPRIRSLISSGQALSQPGVTKLMEKYVSIAKEARTTISPQSRASKKSFTYAGNHTRNLRGVSAKYIVSQTSPPNEIFVSDTATGSLALVVPMAGSAAWFGGSDLLVCKPTTPQYSWAVFDLEACVQRGRADPYFTFKAVSYEGISWVAFSRDSIAMMTLSPPIVEVYSLKKKAIQCKIHAQKCWSFSNMQFNALGDVIAIATSERVECCDLNTGESVLLIKQTNRALVSSFTSCDAMVTVAGAEVRLWNYRTGELLKDLVFSIGHYPFGYVNRFVAVRHDANAAKDDVINFATWTSTTLSRGHSNYAMGYGVIVGWSSGEQETTVYTYAGEKILSLGTMALIGVSILPDRIHAVESENKVHMWVFKKR